MVNKFSCQRLCPIVDYVCVHVSETATDQAMFGLTSSKQVLFVTAKSLSEKSVSA